MPGAYVQLLCPNCEKDWEENASDLPALDDTFYCPDCHTGHPLAEFARTQRDVETLEQL